MESSESDKELEERLAKAFAEQLHSEAGSSVLDIPVNLVERLRGGSKPKKTKEANKKISDIQISFDEAGLLPQSTIEQIINNPSFIDNLKRMDLHGRKSLSESAFVLAADNGSLLISGLVKSPPMGSYEDAHRSYSVSTQEFFEHGGEDLTFASSHFHPFNKSADGDWTGAISPSNADMDVFLTRSIKKPGFIDGILTSDSDSIKLLLFQLDPTKEFNTYYQTFNHGEPLAKFRRLASESGIRNEVLTLQRKSVAFIPSELAKAVKFATTPHATKS